MNLWKWFVSFFWREPDFYIGGRENPYMLRWWIIPRNKRLNIYLHKFVKSDDDRARHDHPWNFVSIMLRGMYTEHVESRSIVRSAPSIAFRAATHQHIVELPVVNGNPVPCWTIVIAGSTIREWGFWCPKGFVHWKQFVDQTDRGNVGRGCE